MNLSIKQLCHAAVLFSLCILFVDCYRPSSPKQVELCPPPTVQTAESTPKPGYVTANSDINRLQDFFRSVLEANRKEFSGRATEIKGFGAGATYPQIWLRDSATVIPLARYHYSQDYLKSWLEEHLSCQKDDGQLYDWIAPGSKSNFVGAAPQAREFVRSVENGGRITISADKNTTESDQETSAVNAAYQIFKITGDRNWLNKKINDRTLIQRLDQSLTFLLQHRFDPKHGLIVSAFTSDWGDVSPIYPDQRAIYMDARTPSVVGTYTNAMFFNAARQMAELHGALGNEPMVAHWNLKSAAIKESINKHLWQEDKGFYRIHLVLSPKPVPTNQDDSDRFAMGGNALAVLFGVADESQTRRIFDVAVKRQQDYSFSTIAGSVIPAFPRGYFKHPALSEEYVYQNGGQWDWFAGRLLLAMFERGDSRRAYNKLVEVAGKAVKNNGLYEWHTKNGEGKGSRDYAGSAGALGSAIFQGLFGVYLNEGMLDLRIRLGDQPGQIRLYEPATTRYVSYDYCYDRGSSMISVHYASNFPNPGRIHILLPEGLRLNSLKLDGTQSQFELETIGKDQYVVTKTDWKPHVLEMSLNQQHPIDQNAKRN